MAILSNGRRCPNAALQGSPYCGLPQHQSLSRFETSQVAVLSPLSEPEVAVLADPDADEGKVVERQPAAEAEAEAAAEERPPRSRPAEESGRGGRRAAVPRIRGGR